MYTIVFSRRFARALEKLKRSGKFSVAVADDYKRVTELLKTGQRLPSIFRDHALIGDYLGYRECHIKGDLLLVYEYREDIVVILLIDIGSHSQIFG
ncbi:hypothetical protein A3C18_04085 [Candidatus Kaiserbacteria bacterium RIFCSPHIGHO2_02_FULL_54_11b]|uniref:Addiction module toxin RelE n=1 Tax=Candidatus Kaiserbacteria bacterium RIFCSPHIGHO2_02_FULL_54_11b TaxID=1798494 RepID=A0A1F6DT33_9BACT|nr:MAG: hypothetical protein A3C18_04085 [Candidatus Kaiserbacteria bacterium RIFCSPHIGHO2_02_FULL_54_11b]